MSDPVSNVEIEDVLSSIRRLVSDDHRSEARQQLRAKTPDPEGRLVLTPALRVAESGDNGDDGVEDDPENAPFRLESEDLADEAGQMSWADDTDTLHFEPADEGLDSAESAVEDRYGDGSSDTPETADADDPPWSDPGTTLYEAAEMAISPEPDGMEASGDRAGAFPADDESFPPDEEAVVDAGDGDDDAGEIAGFAQNDNGDEPAYDLDLHDETASPVYEPDQPLAADTVTLSAKIEALEAAIARTQDQWEPDGVSGDDYAGTRVETIEWQDHEAEAEAGGATPAEAPETDESVSDVDIDETPGNAATPDVLGSEETVLDEDSLREIVADIVREELQGALGERITRNVRKLVRREIHRALTAQELD